jgi:hypothetical protein
MIEMMAVFSFGEKLARRCRNCAWSGDFHYRAGERRRTLNVED